MLSSIVFEMERHGEIRLLVLLFFQCTCAFMNELVIVDEGSIVTLRCPITFYTTTVIWERGYLLYTDGLHINLNLPHAERLHVVVNNITGNFDLQIRNVSSFDEGVYTCIYNSANNILHDHNVCVYLKRLPRNLRFVSFENATDISTIEGEEQTIICVVQSGMPRESLTIIKDGSIVVSGGPGELIYSFVANRSDHTSEIKCMANSSLLIEPLSTELRLLVKYIPRVTFIGGSTIAVTERRELLLTCQIDCYPDEKNISWSLSTDNGESVSLWNKRSLLMAKINRNLSGDYKCHAENEIGKGQAKVNVAVQYPPDLRIFTVMSSPTSGRIDCVPKGEPVIYTFHPWEHQSPFGEHIRFLNGMKNGTLILDSHNKSERYQNDGIYVCTVSNGIEDEFDTQNQHGDISYQTSSSPVFVTENDKVQFTTKGSSSTLTFYIYSATLITGIYLQKGIVSSIDDLAYDKGNVKKKIIWHIFHGKRIRVYGFMVNVDTVQVTDGDYGQYSVVASNSYGTSHYIFEIKPATVPEKPTNITIYPALQAVNVTWIKGFNGGYKQEFYVEIRKPTDQRWDRHGPFEEIFGINQSAIVSGLKSGSVYLLRMLSYNKLGDSNKTDIKTTETRQTQKRSKFLPYILIGVAVIALLILTNGCTRYMLKRKQHRQQLHIIPVNAEPVGVQYGPYDEIGFPADGYLEVVDPVSTNARTSLRDSGDDISQLRNDYLDVTNSASTLARNSFSESSSIPSENECRNDNRQEQSLCNDSNYDYAEPQDVDGANFNPYNSLQGEP